MINAATRCTDHNCPSRDDCIRYTFKPSGNQRVFYKSPRANKKKRCEFFTKRPLNQMEKENMGYG